MKIDKVIPIDEDGRCVVTKEVKTDTSQSGKQNGNVPRSVKISLMLKLVQLLT